MKKIILLISTIFTIINCNAQVPNPTFIVTQPPCAVPTGTILVTSPLTNSPTNLFISEITDQLAGSLTYIEIYNGTGTSISLNNYKIRVFNNGNSSPSCDLILSGTILNNTAKVISLGSNINLGGVIPDLTFVSCGGINNNDCIKLTDLNNNVIDLWGATNGTVFTITNAGYDYRRNNTSYHPNTAWNPSDWSALPNEDYSNVGLFNEAYYRYSLDGGVYQFGTTFANVVPGDHVITVMELSSGLVSNPVAVTIDPTQNYSYITGNNSICNGQSTTLTAVSSCPNSNYLWSNGSTSNSITVSPTQTTNYTVTINSPFAPPTILSQTVEFVNPPTAIIYPAFTTICAGEQAMVNVVGTPNATVTYNVNGGAPQTIVLNSSGNISLTSFPITVNTIYTLMSVTLNGCTQPLSGSAFINVNPLPTATISGTTTICPGNFATATFTGTPNATVTYNVNWGSNQTIVLNSTGTASLITPFLTASSTYTLVSVTSNETCTQPMSGVAVITVNPLPTDVYIASPATCFGSIAQIFFHGQPNTIVNFTILNSFSGPINLTLDAEGNGTYTSFEFFSPGQYFIFGNSVTNSLGCSIVSNQSAVLTVIPPPMMTISTLYELCDNNNDGVECFDLHTKDSEICPNCASQGTTINYYLDANFTTPLPNIYCNTVNPQVIYALAMNNGCGSTTSMTLQAIPCTPINGDVSITSSNNTIGLLDTITVNVQLTNATDLYSLYMKLKGNAAVSQYLDYAGYTIGTLLGTGGSVIATTPTVTNGVYDFGITKVGTVPGYSGSGLFYSFRFVTKNSPIPTGTTFCFYLDEVNAYNTSGVSSALTNQGQYCYTFTNQVNVWPGDLNNSYTVTTADILPIGYFYNATGPARTNTTIQWSAHPATLWGYNHAYTNGDAYKVFADSNGDGVISNADQAAIGFNMNQIHAKMSVPTLDLFSAQTRQTLAAGDLIITPDTAIINGATLPQTVTFTVSLNSTGGLSNLYGIATNLLFDATIFDLSTATIDYTGSIFGATGTDCLVINYVSASMFSVGMTRYANAAINGQGLLFKITLQTKPTIAPLTQTQIIAAVESANNQVGDALVIQEAPVTNLNIINNLGINEIGSCEFLLYPNPAKEQITIQMPTSTFVKQIQLIDMLGRIIKTEHFTSTNTTQTLNLNEVAKGTYFIEVISDANRKKIKKILVY